MALGVMLAANIYEMRSGERVGMRVGERATRQLSCDFDCLAAKPGVFFSSSFETDAEVNDYIVPGTSTTGARATDQAASGLSSLKFVTPGNSGSQAAGSWQLMWTAPPTSAPAIGEGDTLYWYFKWRPNSVYATYPFVSTGGKIHIVHGTATGCGNPESALSWNITRNKVIGSYSACGAWDTRYPDQPVPGDFLLQHGWFSCRYWDGFNDPPNEFRRPSCANVEDSSDEWHTFYSKIVVGNWGVSNSTWNDWIAYENYENNTLLKYTNRNADYNLSSQGNYHSLWLLPYINDKDSGDSHADAITWYDDVILSTQPLFTCDDVAHTCDGPGY